MRRLIIAAAFGAGLLGGAVSGGSDALADGRDDYRNYRHDRGDDDDRFDRRDWRRNHYNGRPDERSYRRRDAYQHRPNYGYGYGNFFGILIQPYPPARPPMVAVRPCHATSTMSYDDYGRRAVIGGVMCYDGYGSPYIVQGSRHIVRYY